MPTERDLSTLYLITSGRHKGRLCKVKRFFFKDDNRVADATITDSDGIKNTTVMAEHSSELDNQY